MKKLILLCNFLLWLLTIQAQRTLLIRNVQVIDVEKGSVINNAQVLIRDSVIAQIITKPQNIKADSVLDGGNRYLIPGLWDMHTHVWMNNPFFPLLLTNGVTGIRDMHDQMIAIDNWRKSIREGSMQGPLIYAAGPIVDGEKPIWPGSVAVKDAVQARRAVDSLKNILHTDFIKVYSLLTRDAYFAIVDEAKKQQISFAGHVPNHVTVLEAAQAGQKSQEHLLGFLELASDSADHYMQVVQKKITDSHLVTLVQRKNFLFRTYNAQKLKTVLQQIKQTDTWICPTITVNYSMSHYNDSSLANDPRLQYLTKFIAGSWKPQQAAKAKTLGEEAHLALQKEFGYKLQILKAIFDAGIPVLAGTDFPNPYCLPGFSLHDELQWFVKAGLTPAQALQTATINPARFLHLENSYGTVAANKVADLVLLDKNPLSDIKNTTTIHAVILHGKVMSREAIKQMLEKLKKDAGH